MTPQLNQSVRIEARAVTRGSKHHFFGYYDKSCWDHTGRWILGLETAFMDRPPNSNDVAIVGMIDTHNDCRWIPIGETRAWNWQQGAMLQWLNGGPEIIFNDASPDGFIARIVNTETRQERRLSRPVYAVNRSGTHAVSLNFSRLQHQRPGYGYAGVPDRWETVDAPEDDGLYAIDLGSGDERFILSLAEAANYLREPVFSGRIHRFNHAQFGANDQRFAFLHRYKSPDEEVGSTRLMTMNIDGSELCCLSDHGLVSHYDWRDDNAILAWAHRRGVGNHYYLFQDQSDQVERIGADVLDCDGHCSFSPDREWVLTDTYPDATHHRTLLLYHWRSGQRIDLGRFYAPPMDWQIRCDLHPRWSRDGKKICIDSIHEGARQMYVLDVNTITTAHS